MFCFTKKPQMLGNMTRAFNRNMGSSVWQSKSARLETGRTPCRRAGPSTDHKTDFRCSLARHGARPPDAKRRSVATNRHQGPGSRGFWPTTKVPAGDTRVASCPTCRILVKKEEPGRGGRGEQHGRANDERSVERRRTLFGVQPPGFQESDHRDTSFFGISRDLSSITVALPLDNRGQREGRRPRQ